MNTNRSRNLPTKRTMLLIVLFCVVGYAALEKAGGFDFSTVEESTRKMLGRAGIIVCYLSALIAGTTFYWDSKAQGMAARAEERKQQGEASRGLLQKLSAELGHRFDSELQEYALQINNAEADLLEANRYLTSKNWLGWSALAGLIVGTLLQLVGAT